MQFPVTIYRFGNFLFRNGFIRLSKLVSLALRIIFGVWLPSSARIGENFTLGYAGIGIVIHSNAIIGKNVTIAQNVTIGRNFGDRKVPVIGNDVYIGAGSVIFGEIHIGNNVIIGANSVVNKDIPDNVIVAGNPMRVLKQNTKLKYYELDNKLDKYEN